MVGRTLGRLLACVFTVTAITIWSAPSASAIESVGDPFGGSAVNIQLGHTLSQSIRVSPVPTSLNGYTVVAVCTALASPDASSTAVETCTVNGVGLGSRVSLPGDASAATTAVTAFRGTWASVCVQASAQFVESILGPGSITNPQTCYPVFLP